MAAQLNFVFLHVRDIPAARDFYTQTLGVGLVANSPDFVQFEANGAATLALGIAEQATPTQTVELWWEVADVDAEHARLAKQGIEIVSGPKDEPFGRVLSIKDPEGNLVNFYKLRQG